MTEFEIAMLSVREAAIWVATAHVIVALLIGAGQIAAICWGIRLLRRMSDDRKLDAETRDRQTEEHARQARERHAEAMAALTELIRRTAAPGTA